MTQTLPKIEELPSIGPKTLDKLQKLDIFDTNDLVHHYPSRYIDFSHQTPISQAPLKQSVTVKGEVLNFKNIYTRFGKNIQKATISDNTGYLDLIWFNQPYISKSIQIGQTYAFAGSIDLYQNKKTIVAPEFGDFNTGKIIPVYPQTNGLNSKWFRRLFQTNLKKIVDSIDLLELPPSLLKKSKLLSKKEALLQIHQPNNQELLNQSRQRLALDEILALQAQSIIQKQHWFSKKANRQLVMTPAMAKKFDQLVKSLPFKLTPAQIKVWHQTLADLISTPPANRLIQGDVGSGKTIVALLACYFAHLNHTQSLLIAPTEILANQHFATFQKFLSKSKLKISLLTSSSKLTPKQISQSSIIIATHAVFYKNKDLLNNLSLLIIDEQHKFGVKQRSFLSELEHLPHTITMTATPIPRTLSLALLGNLSLSYIDQLPKDRLPIKTFLVPQNKYQDCYSWIDQQINQKHSQAYIVCPFIEDSEQNTAVKSATAEFEHLKKVFPKQKIALIHGKIAQKTRDKIFTDFKNNKINILVTTPIIEVGVDVPNSTIIIIQSADRFGLAQLHQLRGRVGRGSEQSYCYLFTESTNQKSIDRLKYLELHQNGLKISEYDLRTRGPGEIFSYLQHGFPSLKLATISDSNLIELSAQIIKSLQSDYPSFDLHQLIESPHLSFTPY